jgi:hypothetical protein
VKINAVNKKIADVQIGKKKILVAQIKEEEIRDNLVELEKNVLIVLRLEMARQN